MRVLRNTLISALLVGTASAQAEITYDLTYHYRDRQIGLFDQIRDMQVFGVWGVNPSPSMGTSGTYSQGGVSGSLYTLTCCPLLEGELPYNPATTGAWTLELTNASQTRTVSTPPLRSLEPMPFVNAIAVSGNGLAPLLTWQLPTGRDIGAVDVSVLTADADDVLIYVRPDRSARSFQIPEGLMQVGQTYRLAVNVYDNTFSQRSLTAVTFVPFQGTLDPQGVFLPTIGTGPGGEPTFVFQPIPVTAGVPILIDPIVVEGYDYAIGQGDPLFASVVFPQGIGDGLYELSYADQSLTIAGGVQHFFGGGVAAFSVRGIEPSAGLSPDDPLAFVTTLTFVADGTFSGTMTPVTVEAIPEPGTWALMVAGLVGISSYRRLRVRSIAQV
jgi:hypothetical protein